jgi:hypothetical protein
MWTNYLITGIKELTIIFASLFILGCKAEIQEDFFLLSTTGEYYYVNTLPNPLIFRVYNRNEGLLFIDTINPLDSLLLISVGSFERSDLTWPLPLMKPNYNADSVVFQFSDQSCFASSRFSDTLHFRGVWDVSNYRNYVKDIYLRSTYTLSYDIGARDTLLAVPCQ